MEKGLLLSRDETTLVKGGSLTQDDQCPYKKRDTEAHKETPVRQRLERCTYKPQNNTECQRTPETIKRRQGRISSCRFQREHGLADSLIWDF